MNEMTTTVGGKVAAPIGSWGAPDVSAKDILLPTILLMHEISDLVKQDKKKHGTLINSVSGETLAEKGAKCEIIPVMAFREWEVLEVIKIKDKVKEEYVRRERMTIENENAPIEFEEEGKSFKRLKTLSFFVLVANQIDDLPYLVRFKKSNLYSGKKLSTHFQVSSMKGHGPAKQVFALSVKQQTSNDFTYYVLEVEPSRTAKPQEEQAAWKWYQSLSAAEARVSDASETTPF